MDLPAPLIPGRLLRRYKRFLADIRLEDGREVTAHCANPGSMMGLADEGLKIWVEPNNDPKKKLNWGWRLVDHENGHFTGVDTSVPNRALRAALQAGAVPPLAGYSTVRAEVAYGENSRVDFLLTQPGLRDAYVEVKSVTLSRRPGVAEFPDSVTRRGTRHLHELARMAQRQLVKVAISVTSLDPKLARTMEPRASTPPKRLDALKRLSDAGIPTTVMVAPVIPALNDMEIERILDSAAHAGVREASYILLRLPLEVRDLFREWLIANYPDRYRHVFALIREMRGGRDYDSQWGTRMKGTGPLAWMIGRRFEVACEKLGLNRRRTRLTTGHFAPPERRGQQLSLF